MKFCDCGSEITTRYGKLCDECLFLARSRGGKSVTGRKMKGSSKDGAGRHKAGVPVRAKCPVCQKMHTVELAPAEIEKGKIPRIYCKQHDYNRSRSILTYGTGARV